eukprot:154074_1
MEQLANKLSYLLDIIEEEESNDKDQYDLLTPLLDIQHKTAGVLSTDGHHKIAYDNVDQFLGKVSPSMEYLFWLSQNIKNEQILQLLMEVISEYEEMRVAFYAKKQKDT